MTRIKCSFGRQIERILHLTPEGGQTLVEYGIIVMLVAIARSRS